MRKLYFYGAESTAPGFIGGGTIIFRFNFLNELHLWIQQEPRFRWQVSASDPAMRRIKRRMAADKTLKFPVEFD
jgi:hypothetical protein